MQRALTIAGLLTAVLLSGCKPKPHKKISDSFKAEPVAEGAIDLSDSLPLMRLAPEQVAAHMEKALGFRLTYDDWKGKKHDVINESYGVALGGVDFEGAFKRDPVAKVTTLLICRSLAWEAATRAVRGDLKGTNNPPVFTKAAVDKDRPYGASDNNLSGQERIEIQAGEARWQEQISELYWRLYSRPPTAPEMATVRAAFVRAFEIEKNISKAWILVLYGLLSSSEFWNA